MMSGIDDAHRPPAEDSFAAVLAADDRSPADYVIHEASRIEMRWANAASTRRPSGQSIAFPRAIKQRSEKGLISSGGENTPPSNVIEMTQPTARMQVRAGAGSERSSR